MIPLLFGSREKRLAQRFEKAATLAPAGPLRDYYAAGMPSFATPFDEAELVALDFETDGLELASSTILEAGLVDFAASGIRSGNAARIRFRAAHPLSDRSVVVHRITDDEAANALPEEDALGALLPRLAGRAIVAHFADIEAGFLDAACRRIYGAPFVAPFVCTMQLESRWFPRPRAADGLRLGKLRSGYHLPAYQAHDGLIDALGCAELLLAQVAHHGVDGLTLGDVVRR